MAIKLYRIGMRHYDLVIHEPGTILPFEEGSEPLMAQLVEAEEEPSSDGTAEEESKG